MEQGTARVRAYYFRRSTMAWLALPAAAILLALWLLSGIYLSDPSQQECHGGGCPRTTAADVMLSLFLSLPVWIRLPAVAIPAGEALTRLVAPLVWTFDGRPDFTIGPDGIYGPAGLGFQRVPWSDVTTITRRVYLTYIGTLFGLTFETKRMARPFGVLGLFGEKPLVIRLRPIHGFPLQEIVDQIRVHAPDMLIFTEEVETRRKRRW